MNKVFISCPMRGRKEEDIKKTIDKMHRIAEAIFGENLEPVDNFLTKGDAVPTNSMRIWLLGEAIKKMASCKYYIGIETGTIRDCSSRFPGCIIENSVSLHYGIKNYRVSPKFVAPDVLLTGEEDG